MKALLFVILTGWVVNLPIPSWANEDGDIVPNPTHTAEVTLDWGKVGEHFFEAVRRPEVIELFLDGKKLGNSLNQARREAGEGGDPFYSRSFQDLPPGPGTLEAFTIVGGNRIRLFSIPVSLEVGSNRVSVKDRVTGVSLLPAEIHHGTQEIPFGWSGSTGPLTFTLQESGEDGSVYHLPKSEQNNNIRGRIEAGESQLRITTILPESSLRGARTQGRWNAVLPSGYQFRVQYGGFEPHLLDLPPNEVLEEEEGVVVDEVLPLEITYEIDDLRFSIPSVSHGDYVPSFTLDAFPKDQGRNLANPATWIKRTDRVGVSRDGLVQLTYFNIFFSVQAPGSRKLKLRFKRINFHPIRDTRDEGNIPTVFMVLFKDPNSGRWTPLDPEYRSVTGEGKHDLTKFSGTESPINKALPRKPPWESNIFTFVSDQSILVPEGLEYRVVKMELDGSTPVQELDYRGELAEHIFRYPCERALESPLEGTTASPST